jgi:hypothetical protein
MIGDQIAAERWPQIRSALLDRLEAGNPAERLATALSQRLERGIDAQSCRELELSRTELEGLFSRSGLAADLDDEHHLLEAASKLLEAKLAARPAGPGSVD